MRGATMLGSYVLYCQRLYKYFTQRKYRIFDWGRESWSSRTKAALCISNHAV